MAGATWRIALASEAGTAHRKRGHPCQDYAHAKLLATNDGPLLIAVASDGAGSAAKAEVASRLVCESFVDLAATHFLGGSRLSRLTREIADAWLMNVRKILTAKARSDGYPLREYSSTFLAAIVGAEAAAFLQIGDGAIVVTNRHANGWAYLFWPQHGEFANTTNFVVSKEASKRLDFDLSPRRIDEVALFTDGIENLVLHQASRSVHEPFFNSIFKPVRESHAIGVDPTLSAGLQRYLALPQVSERTDDDKTLILATRALNGAAKPAKSAR